MNITCGIDIIEVHRVEEAIEKFDERFLNRIYTDLEKTYCNSRDNRYQHFAARFAAKEAVFKALPFDKIAFKKIQIINDKSGAPRVTVKDRRAEGLEFKISLSHTKNFAQAVVLVYKK